MKQAMDRSTQNTSSEENESMIQPLPLGEALLQMPLQCCKVITRPSENTLSQEMGKASWPIVLVQLLVLVLITVALSFLGHLIPSSALHTTAALSIGSVRPFGFLPSPFTGILLVLASFFIGVCTAYPFSRLSRGQGMFVTHLYTLLLCTIPLVTIGGILLLIPSTGWLVIVLVSLVSVLFIYRMVLHALTIMAVHDLYAGRATLIVLIIPMAVIFAGLLVIFVVLLVASLFSLVEGNFESIGGLVEFFSSGGEIFPGRAKRREPR